MPYGFILLALSGDLAEEYSHNILIRYQNHQKQKKNHPNTIDNTGDIGRDPSLGHGLNKNKHNPSTIQSWEWEHVQYSQVD
jgi:hypothetical protein